MGRVPRHAEPRAVRLVLRTTAGPPYRHPQQQLRRAREREQERYGFADIVDVLVYSHEVGLTKPDPAVYALTAGRLGVPSDEVVFLDDTPRMVEAARQAGWHAVEFRNTRQAIAEVEALLD